tara:strand:- start:1224 stop:2345 length:1122 start_codon:yes stop_codon:yes gene_type:complete
MQIIILAAGEGKRIKSLTKGIHKSLLPVNGQTFLSRLMHQLNEYEINKLVVVTGYESKAISDVVSQYQMNTIIVQNDKYSDDVNIYSMKLALDQLNENETTIIIEADIYLDDLALKQIYFESKKDNSIWFTRGKFQEDQYGGILNIDKNQQVVEIDIVNKYLDKYYNFYKLLGITTIGKNELSNYTKLVNEYATKTIKQYYLIPWIENLSQLPSFAYNIEKKYVTSFNTESEYHSFINRLKENKIYFKNYTLINLSDLKPIEDFIEERKTLLVKKLLKDGYWIKPIIADDKYNLIMDGHHRYQVAKELGLKRIPVIQVSYNNIPIWSLRETEVVSKKLVKEKALSGDIYPNKTVKHKFHFEIEECRVLLDDLK